MRAVVAKRRRAPPSSARTVSGLFPGNAFDGGLKQKDPDKQHESLFDAIATVLALAFLMWLPMQMVNLVLGKGPIPSNGSTLATAGDVVFHGDLNRRFRAYDAMSGKQLWETILGGPIAVNTMTYAVNGRQYVAVTTGDTLMSNLGAAAKAPRGHAAVYVFALPQ